MKTEKRSAWLWLRAVMPIKLKRNILLPVVLKISFEVISLSRALELLFAF